MDLELAGIRCFGSYYVASIEFGNEIMGGTGRTWAERFAVDAKARQ